MEHHRNFGKLTKCLAFSLKVCLHGVRVTPGKRNVVMRSAHTRLLHGELVPVEITAACFDPAYQLLLTGARDGTLKVPTLTRT